MGKANNKTFIRRMLNRLTSRKPVDSKQEKSPEEYLKALQGTEKEIDEFEERVKAERLRLHQKRHDENVQLVGSYIHRGDHNDLTGHDDYGFAWSRIQRGSSDSITKQSLSNNLDYRDALINLYDAMGSFKLAIEEASGATKFVRALAKEAQKTGKPRKIVDVLYQRARDYEIITERLVHQEAEEAAKRESESDGIEGKL